MNLTDLESRVYGPRPWRVTADSVSDFIQLTGDDPMSWSKHAPPGFAAAALFEVAPELLAELFDRSVIHGEQTFTWRRPFLVDELLEVTGSVTRVRERGGVFFITFEIEGSDDDGTVLAGRSLFLVSDVHLPAGEPGFIRPEPHHSYRGDPEEGQVSASRADLVRYASATRDWNPVHWDHEAGVAAGFPGVVVHGLLQAGWALRAATTANQRAVASARFRFKNPLLPARPALVSVDGSGHDLEVVLADDQAEFMIATITFSDE